VITHKSERSKLSVKKRSYRMGAVLKLHIVAAIGAVWPFVLAVKCLEACTQANGA